MNYYALAVASIFVFTGIILIRNNRVYNFKKKLLDQLFLVADNDIKNGKDWRWRIDEYDSVGYNLMVLEFWKPLTPESFYEDTSFLEN